MGLDPTAHLPSGRTLDRETYDELMAYWASVGGRTLTTAEIEAIVGAPLEPVDLPTEFGTGEPPPTGIWYGGPR